jgi:hypothetical protein
VNRFLTPRRELKLLNPLMMRSQSRSPTRGRGKNAKGQSAGKGVSQRRPFTAPGLG